MRREVFVGADVHKSTTSFAVFDSSGRLVCEAVVETLHNIQILVNHTGIPRISIRD